MTRTWRDYFLANAWPALPWDDTYRLTQAERDSIASSIQQFQLGEGTEGKGFLRRGHAFAEEVRDPDFVEALRLFIAEEHRHSRALGHFMDLQHIPRIQNHWLDGMFRCVRSLAGLEMIVTVLVTAEVVAVPYYTALRDATKSPLLRAICAQILKDEAVHLEYQAATLARLRHGRHPFLEALSSVLHLFFLQATVLAVWSEHRKVFRAAGYTLILFHHESIAELGRIEAARTACSRTAESQLRA